MNTRCFLPRRHESRPAAPVAVSKCDPVDDVKHIWYRKTFPLAQAPSLAFACLASIGYRELYMNSEGVGDRVLSPETSNLEMRAIHRFVTAWVPRLCCREHR